MAIHAARGSERPDAAGDVGAEFLRRILRELRRGPIDFAHAMLQAVPREPHRIGAEGIRLHHARPRREVAGMHALDEFRAR